jgi:large subunit ribosomal protein L23
MNAFDVIKRPIVTEKSTAAAEQFNQYVFEVDLGANKHQIRDAVQEAFGVNVIDVRTAVFAGKRKRFGRTLGKRSNWKKAVVTLREGESIEIFGESLDEVEE